MKSLFRRTTPHPGPVPAPFPEPVSRENRDNVTHHLKRAIEAIERNTRRDLGAYLRGEATALLRLAKVSMPDKVYAAWRERLDVAVRVAAHRFPDVEHKEHRRREAITRSAVVEKDFWVEQARGLQNQVQHWQRMYGELLAHVQRGETPDDVRASVSEAREALAEPVTGVEAVRALIAETSGRAQGKYTTVRAPKREALAAEPARKTRRKKR